MAKRQKKKDVLHLFIYLFLAILLYLTHLRLNFCLKNIYHFNFLNFLIKLQRFQQIVKTKNNVNDNHENYIIKLNFVT